MQSTNVTVYLFSIEDGKIRKLRGTLWSFGEGSSDLNGAMRTMDTKVDLLTAFDGETEMVFRPGYHFDLQEEGEAEVVTEDEDRDEEAVHCILDSLWEETAAIREHIASLEEGYEEILGSVKRLKETWEIH